MAATATPPNTIFSNSYLQPESWFYMPFEQDVTIPTVCDPNLERYQRLPVFAARTALYCAIRTGELVTQMFIAASMLLERANQYCQLELLGPSSAMSCILHPLVIAAANESVVNDRIFIDPVVRHLYAKGCDDTGKISAIFHDATIGAKEKSYKLLAITTEWAILITQIALTQIASTAAFFAECIQDIDGAFLATDMTTPAYRAAREAYDDAQRKKAQNDSSSGGSSSSWQPSSSYFSWLWATAAPANPFRATPATSVNALPTFTAGANPTIDAATTIDYETIKGDCDALRNWFREARAYILANQDRMIPVRLQNHHQLCYYDTTFQTFVHQTIMDGSFLNDNPISDTMWTGLFTYPDMESVRADVVRYVMGLVKGIETGTEQTIRLDGHMPGIPFGQQWDLLDVLRGMSHAFESQCVHTPHGQPHTLGKLPLGLGIEPAAVGNENVAYTQLEVEEWLQTDEAREIFTTPKGLGLLTTWVRNDGNANIIITYNSPTPANRISIDLGSDNTHAAFLAAINADKIARRYSNSYFTFTCVDLPLLQNRLGNEQRVEPKSFHSFAHPLLKHADFETAVARAITEPYTHDGDIHLQPVANREAILANANALEALNERFMRRIHPTEEACLDRDNWRFRHERHALFRIQVERQDRTLLPKEEVPKPLLRFDFFDKRFDFASCSFHTGSLRGGHWYTIRREGDVFWKIDDCGGNSKLSKAQVEALFNNNGPAGQIREVIYEVRDQPDINPADLFGDNW